MMMEAQRTSRGLQKSAEKSREFLGTFSKPPPVCPPAASFPQQSVIHSLGRSQNHILGIVDDCHGP